MGRIKSLCEQYTDLNINDVAMIEGIAAVLPLIANLEGADVFIDCPTTDGEAIVVAEAKPERICSSYKNTVVGLLAKPEDEPAVARTISLGSATKRMKAVTQENTYVIQSVEPIFSGSRVIGTLIIEQHAAEPSFKADAPDRDIEQSPGSERESDAGSDADGAGNADADSSYYADRTELIDRLIEMEADYRAKQTGVEFPDPEESVPPSLNEKPIEYVGKSEEEIAAEAETALLPDYEKNVNKATEKYDSETDTLENLRAELEAKESADRASTKTAADEARKEYTGDMILQGLVNSTIMSYGNELINRAEAEAYSNYDKEYDLKYNEIRDKLAEAEAVYENALREYDLTYAADLEAKISKLKAEEESRLKEINEYNRKLAEREAAYQRERATMLQEMQKERSEAILETAAKEAEYEKENGISAEKQAEYARRTDAAKEFYSAYDKNQAHYMLLMSSDELITLLGSRNYMLLLNWNLTR